MLVLSRHRDETIVIDEDIYVTVVDIRGDKVRLGITHPVGVSVHRLEVWEGIQKHRETPAAPKLAVNVSGSDFHGLRLRCERHIRHSLAKNTASDQQAHVQAALEKFKQIILEELNELQVTVSDHGET